MADAVAVEEHQNHQSEQQKAVDVHAGVVAAGTAAAVVAVVAGNTVDSHSSAAADAADRLHEHSCNKQGVSAKC